MLQMRDLSDPAAGVKVNWTLAGGGSNRNVIPERAEATADVRVLKVTDYDVVERADSPDVDRDGFQREHRHGPGRHGAAT